jgi:hypothetical protein
MISDDIRDGVFYAQEVRDLARQAHRLLRKEAREPPDGDLPDFRPVLRWIDLLRRQLAQEPRSDLARWLERLRHEVERRRPMAPGSMSSSRVQVE